MFVSVCLGNLTSSKSLFMFVIYFNEDQEKNIPSAMNKASIVVIFSLFLLSGIFITYLALIFLFLILCSHFSVNVEHALL